MITFPHPHEPDFLHVNNNDTNLSEKGPISTE